MQTVPSYQSTDSVSVKSDVDPESPQPLGKKQPTPVGIIHICILSIALFICFCLDKAIAPFSVFFARELNLSFQEFAYILSVSSIGSIFSIFVTPFLTNAKANQTAFALQLAMSVLTIGCVVPVPSPFWWLMLLRLIYGLAAAMLFTWAQSIVSNFARHSLKNRGVAAIEAAWALGTVGFIVVGFILHKFGWRYVFILLGAAQFPFAIVLLLTMPNMSMQERSDESRMILNQPDIRTPLFHSMHSPLVPLQSDLDGNSTCCQILCHTFSNIETLVLLSSAFWFAFAAQIINTVIGAWFERDYGYNAFQTGQVSSSLGLGEIVGIVICIVFDEYLYNKRLACALAAFVATGSVWTLFLSSKVQILSLKMSVGLLFTYAMSFEICFAQLFMVPAQIDPDAVVVTVVQSGLNTTVGLGFVSGAILTPRLWNYGGVEFSLLCVGSLASACFASMLLLLLLHQCKRKTKISEAPQLL